MVHPVTPLEETARSPL